jgi:hypothetical protein
VKKTICLAKTQSRKEKTSLFLSVLRGLARDCSCVSEFFTASWHRFAPKQYIALAYMESPMLERELEKGSAELLILSLVESRARHGYEISKLIEERSAGALRFNVASLYPLLYRLEKRGWLQGRWVEKEGQRPRGWDTFVEAIRRITRPEHA